MERLIFLQRMTLKPFLLINGKCITTQAAQAFVSLALSLNGRVKMVAKLAYIHPIYTTMPMRLVQSTSPATCRLFWGQMALH